MYYLLLSSPIIVEKMSFEMPVVTGLAPVEPHLKGAAGRFNGGWQQEDDNPEVIITVCLILSLALTLRSLLRFVYLRRPWILLWTKPWTSWPGDGSAIVRSKPLLLHSNSSSSSSNNNNGNFSNRRTKSKKTLSFCPDAFSSSV